MSRLQFPLDLGTGSMVLRFGTDIYERFLHPVSGKYAMSDSTCSYTCNYLSLRVQFHGFLCKPFSYLGAQFRMGKDPAVIAIYRRMPSGCPCERVMRT